MGVASGAAVFPLAAIGDPPINEAPLAAYDFSPNPLWDVEFGLAQGPSPWQPYSAISLTTDDIINDITKPESAVERS